MINENVLNTIITEYETPTYIFDEKSLAGHIANIREILPREIGLCYAMKANPFLTATMSRLTDRLEVCSPGEYEICIRNNIAPEKIVVSGVNKTYNSMKRILSYSRGKGIYTIESPHQYDILKQLITEDNANNYEELHLLLRLSSGNQFGMDKETLFNTIDNIQKDGIATVLGIQYYGGTQKAINSIKHKIEKIAAIGKELSENGYGSAELEFGPGLFVPYFTDCYDDIYKQLYELKECLETLNVFPKITLELGRYLTACCGIYITRIMDIKKTKNTNYIIIDGGIHHINYYGQMLGMKIPFIEHIRQQTGDNTEGYVNTENDNDKYTICGSLCTTNDVITKNVELSMPQIGDFLMFKRCGAYSMTEGSALFLSRELPQILYLDSNDNIEVKRSLTQINNFNS